jgi:dipeptidyl aminopeptidase/acylaminoacyl peptidase
VRRDVEFAAADGTTLRGRLYVPEGVKSPGASGVLMTHGFSATIDMALDAYASVMCEAGLAVLVYDHRHLGGSDGEPRQLVNPWRQTRDQMVALSWFAEQPEVDGSRLGVWGSSYSGGQAIVLGAVDERVRAIVANVPFVGGFADARPVDERYDELREALLDDSASGPANATEDPTGPVRVVNEPGSEGRAFMGHPSAAEWFLDVGRRPGVRWQNEVWLQRAFGSSPTFDPGVCIPHLHAAALFVVATEDDVANTEAELLAFDRAPEPKELVMIDGHHFTPYSGDALARAATAARDWFLRRL